jgi:serine/threonine protein kinase
MTQQPDFPNLPDFLRELLSFPLQFATALPFGEEDKRAMPWLANAIRFYQATKLLGQGGRAIALKGFVLNSDGEPLPNFEIVIKLPNLDILTFPVRDIKKYLLRLQDEGSREWLLTRERLRSCKYANPIFDFNVFQRAFSDELLPIPITVQRFLHNATPLDQYLLKTGQRAQPYTSQQGVPVDNWNGMSNHSKWIKLATALAIGLADIHERRVVHGDIWPPNVFLRDLPPDENIEPVFIDFGEAFPFEPKGEPRDQQRDHAYRAPERKNAESIVTSRADVYSFGKLLLHLATGEELILSTNIRGHERREFIKDRFRKRNPHLASDNPFIVDIICNCISVDPVDRPSMNEVVKALKTYVDIANYPPVRTAQRITEVIDTSCAELQKLVRDQHGKLHPFFEDLIAQQLGDIKRLIVSAVSDVVSLRDTREHLILVLVGLFLRLGRGDRFISLTSPRMWQGSALGLNGRYFTATQLAASRGASVQRIFVISVEELGREWVMAFAEKLKNIKEPSAIEYASKLSETLASQANSITGGATYVPEPLRCNSRERLQLVVQSYDDASRELSKKLFSTKMYHSFEDEVGIYVGLLVVDSLASVRELKALHPVSVFQYSNNDPSNRHLLMMTDCLARSSLSSSSPGNPDIDYLEAKPVLRGVMLYKSVLGIPEDKIRHLERLFRLSINFGHWADKLLECIVNTNSEFNK